MYGIGDTIYKASTETVTVDVRELQVGDILYPASLSSTLEFTNGTADYQGKDQETHHVTKVIHEYQNTAPLIRMTLKYDDDNSEAHDIKSYNAMIVTAREGDTVTIEPVLYNGKDPVGAWSEEIPTAMDAGTYKVYYKIKGDESHSDTQPALLTAVIGKADLSKADVSMEEGSSNVTAVTLDGNALSPDTDYELTYKIKETIDGNVVYHPLDAAPTASGSYKVVITGKGNYENAVEKLFTLHTHSYTTDWYSDEFDHWKECQETNGACDAPTKDMAALRNKIDATETELNQTKADLKAAQAALEKANEDLKDALKAIEDAQAEINTLEDAVKEAEEEAANAESAKNAALEAQEKAEKNAADRIGTG